MDANFKLSAEDKRVWLWKLIISIITIGIFSIYFYFTNNLNDSYYTAIFSFMMGTLFVIGKVFFNSKLIGFFVGLTIGFVLTVFIITIPTNFLFRFIIMITIFTFAIQTLKDNDYKITIFSNSISATWQFILIWLGLYIAQHLQILWV